MVDAYHEFSHPREMMNGLAEALVPGGRVYLVEYRKEDPSIPIIKRLHKMSEAQSKKEMTAVGLEWVATKEMLPRQHFMGFEKPRVGAAAEFSSRGDSIRHVHERKLLRIEVCRVASCQREAVASGKSGLEGVGESPAVISSEMSRVVSIFRREGETLIMSKQCLRFRTSRTGRKAYQYFSSCYDGDGGTTLGRPEVLRCRIDSIEVIDENHRIQ